MGILSPLYFKKTYDENKRILKHISLLIWSLLFGIHYVVTDFQAIMIYFFSIFHL